MDTNHYSVPWRLIGEWVTVQVSDDRLSVFHAGQTVAVHTRVMGTVGNEDLDTGSKITLKPGVAYCLRPFNGLVTELVQAAWLRQAPDVPSGRVDPAGR